MSDELIERLCRASREGRIAEEAETVLRIVREEARAELAAERLVAKDNLDWFNALKVDFDAACAERDALRAELAAEREARKNDERLRNIDDFCDAKRLRDELAARDELLREARELIWSPRMRARIDAALAKEGGE